MAITPKQPQITMSLDQYKTLHDAGTVKGSAVTLGTDLGLQGLAYVMRRKGIKDREKRLKGRDLSLKAPTITDKDRATAKVLAESVRRKNKALGQRGPGGFAGQPGAPSVEDTALLTEAGALSTAQKGAIETKGIDAARADAEAKRLDKAKTDQWKETLGGLAGMLKDPGSVKAAGTVGEWLREKKTKMFGTEKGTLSGLLKAAGKARGNP